MQDIACTSFWLEWSGMRPKRCNMKDEIGGAERDQVTDGAEYHAREFGLYPESARRPQNNIILGTNVATLVPLWSLYHGFLSSLLPFCERIRLLTYY